MRLRTPSLLSVAAIAALTLGGLSACTESEEAEVQEEAEQVGDAVEAGAREAAQEVDQATDDLADAAQDQREETVADDQSAH